MSLSEIKQEAQALSPAERAELRSFLRLLDLKEDPARQQELFASLARAKAGQVTSHERLRAALAPNPDGQP